MGVGGWGEKLTGQLELLVWYSFHTTIPLYPFRVDSSDSQNQLERGPQWSTTHLQV